MSESFNNDTALRSEGRGSTQGQQNVDPSTRDPQLTSPDILGEGQGPAQGQGQFDDSTRHPHLGNRADDLRQEGGQSADPDLARHDPTSGQYDQRTRPSDTGGGQGYPQQVQQGQDPQQGQRGQWRQGGQIASDNIPGGYVEPRQAEYRTGCYHQGRSEHPGNSGTTGTGPVAGSGRQDIPNDGPFGGKPTLPERVMGATEKMVGKATGNARMYQHGQERQEGGY